MTEPTYVTKDEVKDMIQKALEVYSGELKETVADVGEEIVKELEKKVDSQLEGAVKYGDPVALQANKGMFMCAEDGGPTVENESFNLTSRLNAGIWESLVIHKGQS